MESKNFFLLLLKKKKFNLKKNVSIIYAIPMIPHASLSPACPVVNESLCPPNPKSSSPLCTTIALPIIQFGPLNEITESVMLILACPLSSAKTFPKSPT